MKKVHEENGLVYYEYSPTFLKPFYINMEPLTLKRRIRMASAYFAGYKVYYIGKTNELMGYCLVQSGKDIRYKFATNHDILVGPYFIDPNYRGQKLSIKLLDYILHKSKMNYINAYDYIHRDNLPSIKASKAVGFDFFSTVKLTKYTRSIILDDSGEYLVFKYNNKGNIIE